VSALLIEIVDARGEQVSGVLVHSLGELSPLSESNGSARL